VFHSSGTPSWRHSREAFFCCRARARAARSRGEGDRGRHRVPGISTARPLWRGTGLGGGRQENCPRTTPLRSGLWSGLHVGAGRRRVETLTDAPPQVLAVMETAGDLHRRADTPTLPLTGPGSQVRALLRPPISFRDVTLHHLVRGRVVSCRFCSGCAQRSIPDQPQRRHRRASRWQRRRTRHTGPPHAAGRWLAIRSGIRYTRWMRRARRRSARDRGVRPPDAGTHQAGKASAWSSVLRP